VSYVLSGNKKKKVSEAVAEKIIEVSRSLNYRPNQIAKSLKSGKTFTIGLVVADISNSFFGNLARIIEDEAAKRDYIVLFGSSDENPDKLKAISQALINRQVDGFIIAPTVKTEGFIQQLIDQKIPFVLIDRYFNNITTDHVIINNFDAAYQLGTQLIKNGKQKIAIIAWDNYLCHMQNRINGALAAIKTANLAFDNHWLKKLSFSKAEEQMKSSIKELLQGDTPVEAIIFATYNLAVYGMKEIEALGIKIPKDVAIVSFDQSEVFDLYYSPVTHIAQPITAIGEQAVKVLINKIENPEAAIQQIQLKGELVVRASCGTALSSTQ
jgi:LacI family transcriptional regulator